MTALVLTPFTAAEAVELGNRLWRKKVLPVGDVEYKGRMLHFDRPYLGQLVDAFRSRAYDQVPFQLADAQNTHTNDPERTRGEIRDMHLEDDGLYVVAEVTPEGEAVLTANPKLGVSARIVENYDRSDGKRFTAAVQHVLGTLDPRIPGLGAWQAIEAASPVPDTVIDLSAGEFVDLVGPKGYTHGWVYHGTGGMAPEDKADRMSRNISRRSFSDGPDGKEAQDAHREAAKAHRQAAKLSSSPAVVAHHQKMAALHSAVASGRMYSYNAEQKMNLAGDRDGLDLADGSAAGFIDLDWATWDAANGSDAGLAEHEKARATASRTARRDAMAKMAAGRDRGGSDEEKAAGHIADAKKFTQAGHHVAAMQSLARATQLSSSPDVYAQASKLSKGVKTAAMHAGNSAAAGWTSLANPGSTPEGTDGMPDLDALTDEQKARLAALLELPDDQLNALAAGGVVVTPDELEALTSPGEDEDGGEADDGDDAAAQINAMSDEEFAALEAEFEAGESAGSSDGFTPNYMPEGEPVGASLSAEAQFAIDLAVARQEETARELAVVTARLREEDYQAEKRKLADLGVPPYITELARPVLEGIGRTVELANGKTADAGQIMRKVLTEYAQQARLLDLDVELGSPMDEPEDAVRDQQASSREDVVARYKAMTGLK